MKPQFTPLLLATVLVACTQQPQQIADLPSQFITINDSVSIHFKVWDNNQPDAPKQTVCFIHGFGCDMNTWQKQFEGLRDDQNLRLVFVDLPGYGASSKPHVDYTISYFCQAVDSVLNAAHVGPAIMVGHSLGTPVARQVMLTTSHIYGMIDIDGVYCFYDDNVTPEYEAAVQQFGSSFDGPQCSEVITGFVQSLAGPETPAAITDYAMSVMPQTPEYVASSTMHNLIERQWWPQFPMPVDVVVLCTQNSGLDPDNEKKMKALFPQADYTELTTCGHFIQMEQPELVNSKIREYAAKLLANGLEDYDFTISNLEQNYAGFNFKVTDANRDEWNRVKQQLRDSVATGGYLVPQILSDLCCWFRDYHLCCTYRQFSTRFPFSGRDYAKEMQLYQPSPVSVRVDADTWLLRFPTCNGDDAYCQWVSRAVEEYHQSGCSRLIVDVRGNGGGNDGQYQPIRSLLYAQHGTTDGMYFRNSADNRQHMRELVGDDEYWNGMIDKCEQDTSAYTQLFEEGHIEQAVDPRRPQQTAVIIDQRVASSGEQFLLDLRAVAPDVKFYGKDNSCGCIDISNVNTFRLPHCPNSLRIPVTISQRVVSGQNLIDGVGIAPDVRLDLAYPDTLSSNIDSWVTWVAAHMAD